MLDNIAPIAIIFDCYYMPNTACHGMKKVLHYCISSLRQQRILSAATGESSTNVARITRFSKYLIILMQ